MNKYPNLFRKLDLGGVVDNTTASTSSYGTGNNQGSGYSGSSGGGGSTPTYITKVVTVANNSGNKFYINGTSQATVALTEGKTYRFYQSDSSNAGHPLRFSTTANGTHASGTEYTTGVTYYGTPGTTGAYTQIVVASGAPTLYYYCSNHSGMGGTATT